MDMPTTNAKMSKAILSADLVCNPWSFGIYEFCKIFSWAAQRCKTVIIFA
jgi:hypothetical protein